MFGWYFVNISVFICFILQMFGIFHCAWVKEVNENFCTLHMKTEWIHLFALLQVTYAGHVGQLLCCEKDNCNDHRLAGPVPPVVTTCYQGTKYNGTVRGKVFGYWWLKGIFFSYLILYLVTMEINFMIFNAFLVVKSFPVHLHDTSYLLSIMLTDYSKSIFSWFLFFL